MLLSISSLPTDVHSCKLHVLNMLPQISYYKTIKSYTPGTHTLIMVLESNRVEIHMDIFILVSLIIDYLFVFVGAVFLALRSEEPDLIS